MCVLVGLLRTLSVSACIAHVVHGRTPIVKDDRVKAVGEGQLVRQAEFVNARPTKEMASGYLAVHAEEASAEEVAPLGVTRRLRRYTFCVTQDRAALAA